MRKWRQLLQLVYVTKTNFSNVAGRSGKDVSWLLFTYNCIREGGMAGRLVNWLWLTYNPFMPEGNAGRLLILL